MPDDIVPGHSDPNGRQDQTPACLSNGLSRQPSLACVCGATRGMIRVMQLVTTTTTRRTFVLFVVRGRASDLLQRGARSQRGRTVSWCGRATLPGGLHTGWEDNRDLSLWRVQ